MRISDWSSDVCSSDLPELSKRLADRGGVRIRFGGSAWLPSGRKCSGRDDLLPSAARDLQCAGAPCDGDPPAGNHGSVSGRSEEHKSELQSLMRISYAVFCLKKNTNNTKMLQNHCN